MKRNYLLAVAITSILSANAFAQVDSVRPGTVSVQEQQASTQAPFLPNAVITQGFDDGATLSTGCNLTPGMAGWFARNNSSPLGSSCWNVGVPANISSGPAPQAGAGYIVSNFNATTGANTMSVWLVSPRVNFGTGAKLEFWTRAQGTYPDRMEVRVSTAADTGTPDVGTAVADVGTFTTLLLTINNTIATTDAACPTADFTATGANFAGYPTSQWCKFTISGAALPTGSSGRIAFRNSVPNGGPTGANSNRIHLDSFSFDEGTIAQAVARVPTPAINFGGAIALLVGLAGIGMLAARRYS